MELLLVQNGEHFGFTEAEVRQIMAYYDAENRFPTMKEWYDGYTFGDTEVYNPWSVINYMYDLYDDLEVDAERALQQIYEKRYMEGLRSAVWEWAAFSH